MVDVVTRNRRLSILLRIAGTILVLGLILTNRLWQGHHWDSQGIVALFALWMISACLADGRLTVSAREMRTAVGMIAVCFVGEAVLMHLARQQILGGWEEIGVKLWPIAFIVGWLWFSSKLPLSGPTSGGVLLSIIVLITMAGAEYIISSQFWHNVAHTSGWVWVVASLAGLLTGYGNRRRRANVQPSN